MYGCDVFIFVLVHKRMHAMFLESLRKTGLYLYSLEGISHLCSSLFVRARVENVENWKKTHTHSKQWHVFQACPPQDRITYSLNLQKWTNPMHCRYPTICISCNSAKAWTNTNKFCIKISEAGQQFLTRSHTHIGSMPNMHGCIYSYETHHSDQCV